MSPANLIARLFVSVLFNAVGVCMALLMWLWFHDSRAAWHWLVWCGIASWVCAPDMRMITDLIEQLKAHVPRPWP